MVFNETKIIAEGINLIGRDFITHFSFQLFVPTIIFVWIIQFLITLILGMFCVKDDVGRFLAIFVLVQLFSGILLFFSFIYPVIPQMLANWF